MIGFLFSLLFCFMGAAFLRRSNRLDLEDSKMVRGIWIALAIACLGLSLYLIFPLFAHLTIFLFFIIVILFLAGLTIYLTSL